MNKPLFRTDKELEEIYNRHKLTIYRVSFTFMKNTTDTEDIVQDTFIQLIKSGQVFDNEEHEKAWLIRTATNLCKNSLKHWWRKREDYTGDLQQMDNNNIYIDETIAVILSLPHKYKTVVYLYYYEGYTSVEIARILQRPQSTIRNYLHEARAILRKKLGGDIIEK